MREHKLEIGERWRSNIFQFILDFIEKLESRVAGSFHYNSRAASFYILLPGDFNRYIIFLKNLEKYLKWFLFDVVWKLWGSKDGYCMAMDEGK